MNKQEFVHSILNLVISNKLAIEDAEKFLQPNSSGPSRKLVDIMNDVNNITWDRSKTIQKRRGLESIIAKDNIEEQKISEFDRALYGEPYGESAISSINMKVAKRALNNTSLMLTASQAFEALMTADFTLLEKRKGLRNISSKCEHSWKQYQGFSENYDYCEKCDLKK